MKVNERLLFIIGLLLTTVGTIISAATIINKTMSQHIRIMKASHFLLIGLSSILITYLLLANIITAQKSGSCTTSACGKYIAGNSCQCDAASLDPKFNDYCTDIQTVCPEVYAQTQKTGSQQIGPKVSDISANCLNKQGSCVGKCGQYIQSDKCGCDESCFNYGDCYPDYQSVCVSSEQTIPKVTKPNLYVKSVEIKPDYWSPEDVDTKTGLYAVSSGYGSCGFILVPACKYVSYYEINEDGSPVKNKKGNVQSISTFDINF